MDILMLVQSPNIHGPLPKLPPQLINALQDLGCAVQTAVWGRHTESATLPDRIISRARDLFSVRRMLRIRRFDIMVVNTSHNWPTLIRDIPLLLLTRKLCPCVVFHMHGSQPDRLAIKRNSLFTKATKWLLERSDGIMILSSEEQQEWQRFYPQGRFFVVQNPFLPMKISSPKQEPNGPWKVWVEYVAPGN